MGLFTKPQLPAPPVTSNGLAEQLTAALDRNAQCLDQRKDHALSSFRRTVLDLRAVNQALEKDVALADKMIEVCSLRKDEALTQIHDNEKVCDAIISIIGEIPGEIHCPVDDEGEGV